MTGKPQTFVSFEEFAISAEMRGVTCLEFAREVGIKWNDVYMVLTGDGKFRFFGEGGAVPCPEGFEITQGIGDYVRELGITNLTIPSSVKSIGNKAFWDCSSLKSVSIPNSVKSIEVAAFSICTSLESVSIPESVESIEDMAFHYCTSLKNVSIPSSTKSIGDYAFSNCTSLISVSISDSVKSIGTEAFSSCTSLVYSGHGHGH